MLVEEVHPHDPRATAVRRAYVEDLATTLPFTVPFDHRADGDLVAPAGAFWVVVLDGRDVGCGGVRTVTADLALPGSEMVGAAELKRFFTVPRARGRGVGRALLAVAEGWAARRAARAVVLETHSSLEPAAQMYRSAGYAPVDRYNADEHADTWLAKPLVAAATS